MPDTGAKIKKPCLRIKKRDFVSALFLRSTYNKKLCSSFSSAHTHANLSAFKEDYKEVVNRALSAGVGMVNVGTQKDTSLRAVEIALEFASEPVFAAIGLHPVHTDKSFTT